VEEEEIPKRPLGFRQFGPSPFCEGAEPIKNLLKRLYLCNKYAPAEGGLLRTYTVIFTVI
jgi:hypothetical protein